MISVIVPVYNVEKYLVRCVDSLINQTYKDIEIILVDDGSSDRSSEICEELKMILVYFHLIQIDIMIHVLLLMK